MRWIDRLGLRLVIWLVLITVWAVASVRVLRKHPGGGGE